MSAVYKWLFLSSIQRHEQTLELNPTNVRNVLKTFSYLTKTTYNIKKPYIHRWYEVIIVYYD